MAQYDDLYPYRPPPLKLAYPNPVTPPPRPGPGVPPPAPVGGGGTPAPAPAPNYLDLIKNSPGYQSWLASRNSRLGNLATNRAAAIRQLVLQYGGIPKGLQDSFGDLRPQDIAAAQGNQFGIMQQIARQDAEGRNNMHRSLAARGVLQSGDLGYGEGQADLARGSAEYDAGQQFFNILNQALQGYTQGAGDVNAEESGIINQLMPLIMQLYPSPAPGAGGGTGGGGAGGGAPAPTAPLRTATLAAPRPARPRQTAILRMGRVA